MFFTLQDFFRFFELRNTPDPGGNLFLSAGNCDTLHITEHMILHLLLNLFEFVLFKLVIAINAGPSSYILT